jgi:hypothetical protein
VRFICECFVPHFVGECGCSESQVYIWWDFLSVSQTDHAMQKRQIECLPIFSDAVCALRAGDEDFYAKEGTEVYDVVTRSKLAHRWTNSLSTETSPDAEKQTATASHWSTILSLIPHGGRGDAESGIVRPRSSTRGC